MRIVIIYHYDKRESSRSVFFFDGFVFAVVVGGGLVVEQGSYRDLEPTQSKLVYRAGLLDSE